MKADNNYMNLILQLTLTEFKLKYAGSVLGYIWTLVKPLLLFGVLYIVFSFFFKLGKGIPNYPVYLLVGVVMWAFFAESTMGALHSIVNRGDLIRKVNFPKIIITLAAALTALLTFILNLVVIVVFMITSKIGFSPINLMFIFLVFELFVFILGLSFILSALFVKFRDFNHIWEVSLQVLFYGTPIIYPIAFIPEGVEKLIMLNPLAQVFQDARWILVSTDVETSWQVLGWPLNLLPPAIVFGSFVFGLILFQKSAKNFAEEL
jgi:ABC-2 type transport system permease protein